MEKVKNAVILAAGIGSRLAPLTHDTPKALIKVKGVILIERLINQLLEAGITEIIIIVGYKKEKFEYLIDKYNVSLIYNPDYKIKNNLFSLSLVLDKLNSSYVIFCDLYIKKNIFKQQEEETAWYACSYLKEQTNEWYIKTHSDKKIKNIQIGGSDSLILIGPAYFSAGFCKLFITYLKAACKRKDTENWYWEDVLKEHIDKLPIYANDQTGNIFEVDDLIMLSLIN